VPCSHVRTLRWRGSAGADLSDTDLSETDFAGADLTGADFSRADLFGASLVGVRGLDTVKGLNSTTNPDKARH